MGELIFFTIILIPKLNKYGSTELIPEHEQVDIVSDMNWYTKKAFLVFA